MVEQRIKSVTIVSNQGVSECRVGMLGVEKIIGKYTVNREGIMHSFFIAQNKEGKTLREIINCPVDVEHFTE